MFEDKEFDNMVSVAMLAYNHEKYIGQAIESILMQKVNFKYEIVIAEDSSTDNTRQIILEYKKKHPNQIVLLLQDRNVGMHKNGYDLRNMCHGKYIAYLEGDDYWINENKLQKQIDFLEKNNEYSGVYHNVLVVDESGNARGEFQYKYPYRKDYTVNFERYIEELGVIGQTASLVCRNFWIAFSKYDKKAFYDCIANGDQKNSLELLFQGKVFYMSDIMANHRKVFLSGDSWTAKTYGKNMLKYNYFARKSLIEYAFNQKKVVINNLSLERVIIRAIKYAIKKPNKENIAILMEIVKDYDNNMKLFGKICLICFKKIFSNKQIN